MAGSAAAPGQAADWVQGDDTHANAAPPAQTLRARKYTRRKPTGPSWVAEEMYTPPYTSQWELIKRHYLSRSCWSCGRAAKCVLGAYASELSAPQKCLEVLHQISDWQMSETRLVETTPDIQHATREKVYVSTIVRVSHRWTIIAPLKCFNEKNKALV